MLFAKNLTRKTWVTEKFLEELTKEQLGKLSVYDKDGFVLTDSILLEKIGNKPWSSQERVEVIKFMNNKTKFEPKVGGYEEQVWGKNAVLEHTKTGTVIQAGGTNFEFNSQIFPQPTSGVVFKEAVVIFLCHTYSISEGSLEATGNLSFNMIPDHQSPVRKEQLENITTVWKGMITAVKGVTKKTYAPQEYDTLVQEVLRRSTMEDRIALEHNICLYFKMNKIVEKVSDKNLFTVWDPTLVFKKVNPAKDDVSAASKAYNTVKHELQLKYVLAFKALPVFKVKYMVKGVSLEKVTKLMQNYIGDMGGPKSSVNATFANRSFIGRMSLRTRQMTILVSVIESIIYSNPGKIVYLEAEVGQIPILCETFKARKIENVRMTIATKYLATYSKYSKYFTTNKDIMSQGITLAMNLAPLPGPKKDADQKLHYKSELMSFMGTDVFIGQCLSDVAFQDRNVYHWFLNLYGYAVSARKTVNLKSRWIPTGREELEAAMQYQGYLEKIVASMKLSYETVYGPLYTPSKNMWSTILVGPSKGITLSFNDDDGYSLVAIADEMDNTGLDEHNEFEDVFEKPVAVSSLTPVLPVLPIISDVSLQAAEVRKNEENERRGESLNDLHQKIFSSLSRDEVSWDNDDLNDTVALGKFTEITVDTFQQLLLRNDFWDVCKVIDAYYIVTSDKVVEEMSTMPTCVKPLNEFFQLNLEKMNLACQELTVAMESSLGFETVTEAV